jgi:hypothetical protein
MSEMKKLGLLVTLCLIAVGVTVAAAQQVGSEGQIASFNAKLSPSRLPRHRLVPVLIRTEGEFEATPENHLAQLKSLEIAVNHHGQMFTKGLSVCHLRQLVATTTKDALAACKPALVGHGRLRASSFFPEQPTAQFKATILAFNGRRQGGGTRIFLHVHGSVPEPYTVIIPIEVRRTEGTFGTAFFARMPGFARRWAYLTKFRFVIGRRFKVAGKERSFLRASCPAPEGFDGAVFPFARATYRFLTTKTLRTTLVGGCRVRKE